MDAMRKHTHEEEKRTRKMRKFAESMGLTVKKASNSLLQAREALNQHPELQNLLDAHNGKN